MSNEIKQGDIVRVSKDAPKMFRCGFNHVYTTYISKVLEVDDGNAIIEMTMETKEREAYRKACRHYGAEGNCHVQSRTFFTRSEISDTELKIHMIANCTPHSICARMRRYDKRKKD